MLQLVLQQDAVLQLVLQEDAVLQLVLQQDAVLQLVLQQGAVLQLVLQQGAELVLQQDDAERPDLVKLSLWLLSFFLLRLLRSHRAYADAVWVATSSNATT